ncbi:glycosyltransferase family 39 protein [Sphingomicrobium sediminis]|uniref:Glycosyltransferase family 39 protein n=1 Tax=Sphingomicrobium sediminis TaxID=2950949 RepID=A0A9X2J0L7_9SPHN|nr:glycosyltransferase family 39 protein [Sphingomicrobium sediminis]MCM8556403.1 glycosyltransferase family 39 protein [Sphingomicrobium sediminis]
METITPASETRSRTLAFVAAGLFAILCVWLNPVGYVGAGADDEQYLEAARCWVAYGGPCLPEDHWWSRWPVIAPVAASIALFGESRFAVGVGPALSWALAMFSIAALGTRWFGWRAGVAALVALAATPVVAVFALTPNPNVTELAFQLAALLAATIAFQRQSVGYAVLGGLLAAFALASRNTSILFLGISAWSWLFLDADKRKVLLWAILGLAIGVMAEMAVYAAATGDPLYRYLLAMNHTGIPSAALPDDFDITQSALFNPAYVAAWEREAGVQVFWPIDGWLNLMVGARMAPLLWSALFAVVLLRSNLAASTKRHLGMLWLATAFIVVMLTWGLAIDPKARMFMGLAAVSALTLGAIIKASWGKPAASLALGLLIAHVGLSLVTIRAYPASREAEKVAATWIAEHGDRIELHHGAASYLTLLPESHDLPLRGAGRDLLIAMTGGPCEALVGSDEDGPTGRVLASAGGNAASQGRICLFEYADDYWERFPERLGAGENGVEGEI